MARLNPWQWRSAHGGTFLTLILFALGGFGQASGADFSVTSPGSSYTINGLSANPVLTLVRGQTYTFAVTTSGVHPFRINAPAGTTTGNNTSSGTITFFVPTNAVNYTYQCSIHGFGAAIQTIPPPAIRIVNVALATNLTVRSLGTNNWRLLPQFSTNLATTNWFNLTVETNRFANGTNETICGRPSGSNLFLRLQALRN